MRISIVLILFITSSWAASDFKATNPRDNAVCYVNGKRLEILIRGASEVTEPAENGFGESLYMKVADATPVALNSAGFDSYKIFPHQKSLCNKTLGYLLEKDLFIVFLLKENRPFQEKLSVLKFDFPDFKPSKVMETEYLTKKAFKKNDSIYFLTSIRSTSASLGKVTIKGAEYTYQNRDNPLWLSFSKNGFQIQPSYTYKNLPWRRFFKNEKDFLDSSGWDPTTKKFNRPIAFMATNSKLKKKCVLFMDDKHTITGSEPWRCQ